LSSPELAVERVRNRVISGGHNIPNDVVHRKYWAGIKNLSSLYLPICDYWLIIDNSFPPFKLIAEGFKNDITDVYDNEIFELIVKP
jgi:predicted ABC-type ATPase